MATSAQLKALVRSFAEQDEKQFYSYAMQIAAHEAKVGHTQLARELKDLIDKAKESRTAISASRNHIQFIKPKGELASLLSANYTSERLVDMILGAEIENRLNRIIKEQRQMSRLLEHNLKPRRKFLLLGPPGTGKTLTASALAGELKLPLFVIRLDGVITKFMGETSAKLRLVFDAIKQQRGVFLFDEFDSIGTMRSFANDVGEIRRVLNSFLQFIDQDESNSLILAATNHPRTLDYALFRRFDDVIEYENPSKTDIQKLFKRKLKTFKLEKFEWSKVAEKANGLSYAEICRAIEDALKETIIHNDETVSREILYKAIEERQSYHKKIFKHDSK